MSFIDRLNATVLRKSRGDSNDLRIDGDALLAGGTRYEFTKLTGAVVTRAEAYASDVLVLVLAFGPAPAITVPETSAAWPDLVTALDRSGRLATPSRVWLTQSLVLSSEDRLVLLK